MKKILNYLIVTLLGAFGLLTFFLSSSIIFDLFGIREMEGNYVPFIVWANFICSLLYLFAAYGFIKERKWTVKILGMALVLLLIAFIGLMIYINKGGIHETKTIGAMSFRIGLTSVFAAWAFFTINKKRK